MKRFLNLLFFGLLLAAFPAGDALARGGGGRGGGGRGGGGRGGGGRGGSRGGGGRGRGGGSMAGGGRNNERKEEEKELRREERMARVAEARLLYAKRERRNMWNGETNDRFGSMLARILGGASD
ncbi:MAG: hypothetical protein ACYS0E_01915 [Planctomycetota bacterium]|jgi:hypothetical protein